MILPVEKNLHENSKKYGRNIITEVWSQKNQPVKKPDPESINDPIIASSLGKKYLNNRKFPEMKIKNFRKNKKSKPSLNSEKKQGM